MPQSNTVFRDGVALLPWIANDLVAQSIDGYVSASVSDYSYSYIPASAARVADDDAPVDADNDGFADNLESGSSAADGAGACCEGCGSVYVGFEFTSLFPEGSEYVEIHSFSAGGLDQLPHIPFGAKPDGNAFDLTRPWGYRVWAGGENSCGQGLRGTYWQWNDEANLDGLDFDDDLDLEATNREIDIWTADLEGTQSMCYGDLTMLGTLGVRVADFDYVSTYHEFATANPLTNDNSRHFTGVGITGSVEGRRMLPILCCWEGFAKLRGSLVFGNTDFEIHAHNYNVLDDIDIDFDVAGEVKYETYAIWETQVGVERQWCTAMGTLFVRAAFEAQLWEIPPVNGVGDANLGLVGSAFGAGFTR